MKVHHVVQIMKGSFHHQSLIFHFVSVLTDGSRMEKRNFQFYRKWLKFLISGRHCQNPNKGARPGENMNYEFLLSQMNDLLVLVKLHFFEETAKNLSNFLVTFQTSSPMVHFIVDSLENLVCSFVERFILSTLPMN